MQNEKDLFDMLKEMYPQHPRKEFVSATENTLRQRARSLGKKDFHKILCDYKRCFSLCIYFFMANLLNGSGIVSKVAHSDGRGHCLMRWKKRNLWYIFINHITGNHFSGAS